MQLREILARYAAGLRRNGVQILARLLRVGTRADDRHRVGAYALARDAAGRVGDVEENERDKLHPRVDVTTGALRPHACGVWSRHLWA